jgi:hypothetical protein
MVLQSGIVPYEWDITMPFRGDLPSGVAGLIIEQAMWVAVAERRRLRQTELADMDLDHFQILNPSGPGPDPFDFSSTNFEPTPGADNFDFHKAEVGPLSALVLDYIVDLRRFLKSDVWSRYDTEYTDDAIEADVLNNFYPGSSGQAALNDPFGDLTPYARQEQPLGIKSFFPLEFQSAFVLSNDINTLGGSGVMFDRDFGEVMFNPFPWISSTNTSDLRDNNSNIDAAQRARFMSRPFFPMFQKPNGTLITTNSRESSAFIGAGRNADEFTISDAVAGRMKLNGDLLFADTKYRIGVQDIETDTYDTDFVDHFTYVSSSDRVIVNGGGRVPDSRVFLTPGAKAEGVYRVAVVNEKADFPNGAVPSGLISTWPPPSGMFQLKNTVTQQIQDGYEVLNAGFWVNEGSGLALISPFTGRALWVRPADNRPSPNAFNTHTWEDDTVGLELIGNQVVKMVNDSSSSPGSAMGIMRWNADDLDFVDDVFSSTLASAQILRDFCFDGTNYYAIDFTASNLEIFRFDSSFNFVDSFESTAQDFSKTKIFAENGQILVRRFNFNDERPVALLPLTFPATGSIPVLGTPKEVINFIGPAIRDIYDMTTVTGSTTVTNGNWALGNVSGQTGGSSPAINSVFLLRLEELATEWHVREMIEITDVNFLGTDNINFIYRDIN